MRKRIALTVLLLTGIMFLAADGVKFTAFSHGKDTGENATGLWFCPNLGSAKDVIPLKTWLYATQESVTGGVALKAVFHNGSRGIITYEKGKYAAGTAGITFYAKASRPLKMKIRSAKFTIPKEWTKIDLSWEQLGTTKDARKLGWQWELHADEPINETIWVIIDRLGTEGPTFDPQPTIKLRPGPDKSISSKDIIYGAENLKKTRDRLKKKQPFKIIALGDSVTAGAQMSRGSWGVKGEAGVSFLYFAHLARICNQTFGYEGVTPVQFGHGGWTTEQALRVVDKEVVANAGPEDLVILEFGANDMGGANNKPEKWEADMHKLIARVKTKTDQIIILSPTAGGNVPKYVDEISKRLRNMAKKEKVAAVDITKLSFYRGPAFAWAWLANGYHPDFMGHITMGEMIAPVLTGKERQYPALCLDPGE